MIEASEPVEACLRMVANFVQEKGLYAEIKHEFVIEGEVTLFLGF